MYSFIDIDMLKVFQDIDLSKTMYIKDKNMIVTASRGRRIKVILFSFSFGKFLVPGEIQWLKFKKKEKYK